MNNLGGESLKGYTKYFIFSFCIDFKRKSYIYGKGIKRNYTEEVYVSERKTSYKRGSLRCVNYKE